MNIARAADSQIVPPGIRTGMARHLLRLLQLCLALPGRPEAAGQHRGKRERPPGPRAWCGRGARRVFTRPPPAPWGVALVHRSLREGRRSDEAAGDADPGWAPPRRPPSCTPSGRPFPAWAGTPCSTSSPTTIRASTPRSASGTTRRPPSPCSSPAAWPSRSGESGSSPGWEPAAGARCPRGRPRPAMGRPRS